MSAPERTCAGCRTRAPRAGLLRFVADERGHLRADPLQRQAGRGVYVCAQLACLRAATRGGFARGLKRRLAAQAPERLAEVVLAALRETASGELAAGLADGRARRAASEATPVVGDERLRGRLAALREQERRLEADVQRLPEALAAHGEVRVS